jgi:oligosaccharyltransferase complex subunit epsilon
MQTSERPPSGASSAAKKTSAKTIDGVSGELVEEKGESKISSERAFADYVLGSLILHGFCVNFIN